MIGRFSGALFVVLFAAGLVHAQDVPGIEICTAEKTMGAGLKSAPVA